MIGNVVLAVGLTCFFSVICPDMGAQGMQNNQQGLGNRTERDLAVRSAQQFFAINDYDGLDFKLSEINDSCDVAFAEPYRDSWKRVISAHIDDPAYTRALNLLLIFAAGNGWSEGIRMILTGNTDTSCSDQSLASTPMLELLFLGENPENVSIDVLNTILELRPDSDFAKPLDSNEFITPLSAAVENGQFNVVQWFLDINARRGKNIALNNIDEDGHTPLECAVTRGHSEIVRILINYRDSDGKYGVDVQNSDNDQRNVLALALSLKNNDDIINIILDSGRIDLNAIIDTLKFNKADSLSPTIMTRLRDTAVDAQLQHVLSALDIYSFWQAIENNRLDVARRLLSSNNFDIDTMSNAISSAELKFCKEECYVRICSLAAERQLHSVLSSLSVHDFRKALESGDWGNVQPLLTSGRVNFDNVVAVLNSNDKVLSLPVYRGLLQTAHNAKRQDIIQALRLLDNRIFMQLEAEEDWQNILDLLKAKRVVMSQQSYNRLRYTAPDQVRIRLDVYFLGSRFTLWGWNELPTLLDSGQFDNLISDVLS